MTATFRGVVLAHAVAIDPRLVGVDEARRRALGLGPTDLRELPDGRWLALLPGPVEVRTERCLGQPFVSVNEGLAVPGLAGTRGSVSWLERGEEQSVPLVALRPVAIHDWIDLAGAPRHDLQSLDQPEPMPRVPPEPPRSDPDLGAGARVTPSRVRAKAGLFGTPRSRRRGDADGAVVAVVGIVLVAVVTIGLVTFTAHRLGDRVPPVLPFVALLVIYSAVRWGLRRLGLSNGRTVETARPRGATWLQRVLRRALRRPQRVAAPLLRRSHERYLRRLTSSLDTGRWDDLLGDAIGLGGAGEAAWLRLRLPSRRDRLDLTFGRSVRSAVPMGESAHAYLLDLYRRAARRLEESGQIERATFVHAELLHDSAAAVALLEQQGRLRLAAELAEARDLDPGLIVRLWWRAGDRGRAVFAARSRGAFAAGIARLDQVDPAASRELRVAWVRECRAAGDPAGAVRAAWPDGVLRSTTLEDIQAGMSLGGEVAGTMLAYLAAEYPSEAVAQQAVALVTTRDRELRRAREAFTAAFVETRSRDAALDRRVASAAVRSLFDGDATSDKRRALKHLDRRADPLLRADHAPLGSRAAGYESTDLRAPAEPGQLATWDVVALRGRAILAAHAELGVRLYTLDGRVRGRWDVVAHEIVLSDNNAVALLVRRAGAVTEIHRLDLVTRRVRPWALVRLGQLAQSFDGTSLVAVDGRGIVHLDTLAGEPRVLWRELDHRQRSVALSRVPGRISAVVDAMYGQRWRRELWVWDVSSRMLRVRRQFPTLAPYRHLALGDSTVVVTSEDSREDWKLSYVREYRDPVVVAAAPGTRVVTSGSAIAVLRSLETTTLCTVDLMDRPAAVYATFPGHDATVSMREHNGLITVWDRTGRIVAADSPGPGHLASFATRA